VHALTEALVRLRVHIEAAIDFPEEEIDILADTALQEQFQSLQGSLAELRREARQGSLLHDGMTVVLAGRSNAGKSSLLNALAQRDSAIVSELPGTTRDIVREQIAIDGMPLHVLDTAGLRVSQDAIEGEGVRRARQAMERADRVLLLVDDAEESTDSIHRLLSEIPANLPVTLVRNKIDISGRLPGVLAMGESGLPEVALSARSGAGLDMLRAHLKECMGYETAGQGTFSARRRHLEALETAQQQVASGALQWRARHGDLAAEELRHAQRTLGEITGEFTSDDLLGRIFSDFCIGK
jgi:tRNA modification GTPase